MRIAEEACEGQRQNWRIGDSCVLKISDSFEHPTEDPGLELELKVKVLKISPGKNKELMDTYQTLNEYMLFVKISGHSFANTT